jgi:hypothetical protein
MEQDDVWMLPLDGIFIGSDEQTVCGGKGYCFYPDYIEGTQQHPQNHQ